MDVLEPDPEVPFSLTVRNNGDETVDLRFFRFELMTLGLNWWHYDLRAHVEVPPRAVRTISEPLDFFHADETGKGYIESKLALSMHQDVREQLEESALFYKEFRRLPPNHLRCRVGVSNRVFGAQDSS